MNAETSQHRPSLSHLLYWFLFANGGGLTALVLPVHILVQGILGPLGIVLVVDQHQDTWINILGNPLVKLYLLALIGFAFFHFAHRLRYLLVDFGLHAAKGVPGQVIFYGAAVLVTLIAVWVLLTTAPIKLG